MICPKCGNIDKEFKIPFISNKISRIGRCSKCSNWVFAVPTTKKEEGSQLETVKTGESREEELVKIFLKYYKGFKSKKREDMSDIDREIQDENGKTLYYLEIKERSNSVNAYKETQFPFAKITEAKRLIKETGLDVYILIKFIDCWSVLKINPEKKYKEGRRPFVPKYRPGQMGSSRQIPVQINVEDLRVLKKISEYCKLDFDDLL